MITDCQRWRERRASYRPAGETIRTSEYDVAPIAADAIAKAFVQAHHYSGTYPAARFRVGLYHRGELAGVAVFSHPCSDHVLTRVFPHVPARSSVELGRFVLLDEVPANGETWFLARALEHVRAAGVVGVVSFSDPITRTALDGQVVHPGHVGTIYQASNARFLGRGAAGVIRVLPDATVMSARAIAKIRNDERGWASSAARLEEHGAGAAPLELEARRVWLHDALERCTRRLRHPGNFRYAFALDRHAQRALAPAVGPYPKHAALQVAA